MKAFYIIKKSAGYAVKALQSESNAREFAAKCCKANFNNDFIVCVYADGNFQEI